MTDGPLRAPVPPPLWRWCEAYRRKIIKCRLAPNVRASTAIFATLPSGIASRVIRVFAFVKRQVRKRGGKFRLKISPDMNNGIITMTLQGQCVCYGQRAPECKDCEQCFRCRLMGTWGFGVCALCGGGYGERDMM